MNSVFSRSTLTAGAFALAVSSIIATRVFKQFSIAEVLAVAAFACGLASWLADRSTDRLITIGFLLYFAAAIRLSIRKLSTGTKQ
jgi:hypothetical protein